MSAAASPPEIERRTIRRITWHVMPFLVLCFMTAYLDRVNIGYAAVTMSKDLGLTAANYGLASGLFFVTYFLFEIPSNLAVLRFGPRRWFARIMLSWGVLSACMAFVTTPTSLYVVRLLLGAAEAGFVPGVLLYLTQWFPARVHGRIMGLFLMAGPLAGVVGGPISAGLLSWDGFLGLRGWQWLFMVEAAPAILLAGLALRHLSDTPQQARWLPDAERAWLVDALERDNQTRVAVAPRSVLRSLGDPKVVLLAGAYFGALAVNYMLGFFLPPIIKGLGMSNTQTGFLAALPYLAGLLAQSVWPRVSDRNGERILHAAASLAVACVAVVAASLIDAPGPKVAALVVAGLGVYGFTPVFWTLPPQFLSGVAAAAGIALINSVGNLSGFLTPPLIGYARDMTGSYAVSLLLVAGIGACGVLCLLFVGRLQRNGPAQPR